MQSDANRYDFLDWLRVLAIGVLVFYHTGMIFVGWGWHIENGEVLEALRWPMSISHRLRMPLLFVIAGAGLWFALRGRTWAQMLRERSLRLLLPAILCSLLIVSPQVYFERLFRGQWQGGYLEFFFERVLQFQPYPQGDFSWHHLWFIVYLYVYVLLLLPLLVWLQRSAVQLRPGRWLYWLAAPLVLNEISLKPLFPETHNLVSDWYLFNHYLLFTLYGFLLARMPGVWDWLMGQRRITLGCTLGSIVAVIPLMEYGILRSGSMADATVANVFTWVGLMAFMGYGRRYLSFSNSALRWTRDASYPIYILHQTVIVAIGYSVIQFAWSPWVKFWTVSLLTVLVCALTYQWIVRRFAVTRVMFGLKLERASQRHRHLPAVPET